MPYHVTDNSQTVYKDLEQKSSIFLRNAAEEIVSRSLKKTPKKFGNLRKEVLKQVLGLKGKIQWRARYAIYQEEKLFKNYSTPGTGPRFAQNAVREVAKNTGAVARRSGLI